MKKVIISTAIFVPVFLSALIVLSGCKQKGCTDKSALNYNSVADKNDGSCLYCTMVNSVIGNPSAFLVDENNQSPFFGQQVAEFDFTQNQTMYNDQACSPNNTNANTDCNVVLSIKNLVGKGMDINYTIQCFSGVEIEDLTGSVSVGAGQTVNVGKLDSSQVFNPCSFFNANSINIGTNTPIVYH